MNKNSRPLTSKTVEKMRKSYYPSPLKISDFYSSSQFTKANNKSKRKLGQINYSSSMYSLYPALKSNSSFNFKSTSNLQHVNETLFKLYDPIQRINRLRVKMLKENHAKQELFELKNVKDDKNQLKLINININNKIQATDLNSFKPNRSTKRSKALNKIVSCSDWSRKSMFE